MRFRDALREIVKPATVLTVPAHDAPPSQEIIHTGPLGLATWLESRGGHEALSSMAYLACELAKTRPISMLPVHIYEKQETGRAEAHDPVSFYLGNLLRNRWNPTLKAPSGLQWLLLAKDTFGYAYVRVEWAERQGTQVPVALWPLTGQVIRLWDDQTKAISYRYIGDQFTPEGIYSDREILAFSSPLSDLPGTEGRSLAQAAMAAVGLDIDLYEFYSKLLHNGTHMPYWIETDDRMRREDREELLRSIRETNGIFGAGFVRILDGGKKLRQTEVSPVDMSYLDEARWVLQTVCRICGVPPNEVYDHSQLTYSGNVEMSAIQFASKTLMPECKEIESGFDCALRAAGLPNTHVKLDMNGLLRGQYESRMKGYQIGIFTGFFTIDEVREWEELPKTPGGDTRMWPTNYYQVDEGGNLLPPPKADTSESFGAPGAAGDIPSEPKKALAEDLFHKDFTARIRERVAEKGDTPATREFAAKVLSPWAHFCARAGIPYDFDAEIEGLMRND